MRLTLIKMTSIPKPTTLPLSVPSQIPTIPSQISFPQQERDILAFWTKIDAFQTSLKLAEGRPRYSFYDGIFYLFKLHLYSFFFL